MCDSMQAEYLSTFCHLLFTTELKDFIISYWLWKAREVE